MGLLLNKFMGGEIKGQHSVCSKMVFGRSRFCIFRRCGSLWVSEGCGRLAVAKERAKPVKGAFES